VKTRARSAWQLFQQNPEHPSLRFKKLQAHENLWSVRINEQYRAVGFRTGETIVWIWIGTHNEFDHLFS
jgi:plasmid maintenance system killer protein